MLETFSFSLLSFLAAVRVAEQAKKESNEKEKVSSMAERSSGALSFRLAEQLRNFARDLEMRPAEIMQELAGWQREQEAKVALEEAEAHVPKAEKALSEAEHLRDELLEEAKHLDVVVEMLHNSLKALNQLRHHNGKALVAPQGFPGQETSDE